MQGLRRLLVPFPGTARLNWISCLVFVKLRSTAAVRLSCRIRRLFQRGLRYEDEKRPVLGSEVVRLRLTTSTLMLVRFWTGEQACRCFSAHYVRLAVLWTDGTRGAFTEFMEMIRGLNIGWIPFPPIMIRSIDVACQYSIHSLGSMIRANNVELSIIPRTITIVYLPLAVASLPLCPPPRSILLEQRLRRSSDPGLS